MKMIILRSFLILCVFLSGINSPAVYAGKIVYPWRAVSAFVKSGESFYILYDNISFSQIDSVILTGPFNNVTLSVDSVNIGIFEYDSFTQMAVNNKIWVKVPLSAPEELYDLAIHTDGETVISPRSVKVVKEFSQSHSFIHISDPHITRQWEGTAEDGYAKELELFDNFVKVANIISPDFVIVTGDVIHHYTRMDADSTGWGGIKLYDADQRPLAEEKYRNYFYGAKGFSGIYGLNSPTFSLPGNHDFYGIPRGNNYALAAQWNKLCGKRVYGFSYAGTRVIVADDYLGDPVIDIPDSSPMSGLQGKTLEKFLEENGTGSMRIMAQHRPDRIDTQFINRNKINILLNGHRHVPFHEYVGTTPTLSSRPGTVCRSGDVLNWKETLGFFRIFYIHNDKFEFTPPLRFCKNPIVHYNDLELNLLLDFKNPNDGSSADNEAIISNLFPVELKKCKIRFVMKKGNYEVSGGVIQQIIENENLSIVDVRVDVDAESTKEIIIKKYKD